MRRTRLRVPKMPNGKNQRGIAMMMCLFALLLLTTIAAGLMFMANTETTVNSNYRASTQAFYSAKSGLEEARERLRYGNPYSLTPPSGIPSTTNANGIVYVLNTPTVGSDPSAPWDTSNRYFDDELCNEPFYNAGGNSLGLTVQYGPCATSNGPPAGSFTSTASIDPGYDSNAALGYKWVRITPKQNCTTFYGLDAKVGTSCNSATNVNRGRTVCADPNDRFPSTDPVNGSPREIWLPTGGAACESVNPPLRSVYVLTSMASSVRGPRRITQYEVASVTVPPFPAGIMLDGGTPIVSLPNANGNIFDGNDHASGAGCTAGAPVAAIGTTNDFDRDAVRTLAAARAAQYTGLSGTATVPSVETVPMNNAYRTVDGLTRMVAALNAGADQVFSVNNPSPVVLGTDANPKVTVVNGDFTMDGTHGAGLLLVTGNLTINANPDFNGTILAIGKGHVTISTNTNTAVFNGNMLIANLFDGSGNPLPINTFTLPGPPSLAWNGAGTSALQYDSCWVTRVASRLGFKVIADREEMY